MIRSLVFVSALWWSSCRREAPMNLSPPVVAAVAGTGEVVAEVGDAGVDVHADTVRRVEDLLEEIEQSGFPGVEPFAEACPKFGGRIEGRRCVDLPLPKMKWSSVSKDSKKECSRSKGTWRVFSSTQTDPCEFFMGGLAGAAMTPGCDCGPDACWLTSGALRTCVPNPPWHHKGR